MALLRMRRNADRKTAEPSVPGLQSAYDSVIYSHIFSNADREVGGVLVGRAPREVGLPRVTGAIPAISADEQRATLTFTQDSWEHVHRTLESEFPEGEQIVGWYHSHPGFGIFLSGHDLFIQENFFNGLSQIAVVVDPIAGTEGSFVWRDGEIVALYERPTPEHWVAKFSVPADQSLFAVANEVSQGTTRSRPPYPALAIVVAAVLGLLTGFGLSSVVDRGSLGDSQSAAAEQKAGEK